MQHKFLCASTLLRWWLLPDWIHGRIFSLSCLILSFFTELPVFELSQYTVVQSWNDSPPLCVLQIAPLIVFVSASTQTYSTPCPGPVCRYVVETLKETAHFDGFSAPSFHGFWPCCGRVPLHPDLSWQPWKQKKKQPGWEVVTLALLCCDSRVRPVMRRQTRRRVSAVFCSLKQRATAPTLSKAHREERVRSESWVVNK